MLATAASATPAGSFDLTSVQAQREVKDVVLSAGVRVARAPKPSAHAAFTDTAGLTISIDSTVPTFDLNQVAAVLNSTYHHDEISRVKIHVVTLADMAAICHDPKAVACYRSAPLGVGELWFAADDFDWIHSLVHEYGHHMDNQYGNLGQLHAYGIGLGCTVGTDGTRNWFFARLSGKNTTDAGAFTCLQSDWEHLLPELFAEDFVFFNGISNWQLSSAQPPTSSQLNSMKSDFENKVFTAKYTMSRKIKHRRAIWKRVSLPNWAIVRVDVSGGRGRDFDVWIFEKSSNKAWARATHNGRKERLTVPVPPGSWDIGVAAFKKTGNAKIKIRIF